jgi:methylthioribose-1-phosphate isomerase
MSDNQPLTVKSIEWNDEQSILRIIDQTFLPGRTVYSDIKDTGRVWEAIKKLRVRGAPAIGISAAYGFYLGIKDLPEDNFLSFKVEAERIGDYLKSSRPTAVNLGWAVDRLLQTINAYKEKPVGEIKKRVLQIAKTIHSDDRRICKAIGELGAELVKKGDQIITHCNTGGLATAEYGTALSVIYHAHIAGKDIHVWVDETRPLLQGARLTTYELSQAEVPFTLITDSMAGMVMQQEKADMVIVGTDRVAANGDTANKIGTYSLAVLANAHNIPFYVAAPLSSIDLSTKSGKEIPIEERDSDEVTHWESHQIAPKKTTVYNPAFDVTPASLISGFITEKGIVTENFEENLKALFE